VGPAATLTTYDIAVIIVGSTSIAVTQRATLRRFRKTIGLRHTLVTVLARHIFLTLALSGAHNASGVVQCTQGVAGARLAALGVIRLQIPVTILALITTTSRDKGLAMAGTCYCSLLQFI